MLSATFHDRGGVADDPDFSVDLTRSTATFRTPSDAKQKKHVFFNKKQFF